MADAADGGGGAVHLLAAVGVGARGLLPRRHQAGQGELGTLHPVSVLLRGRLKSHLQPSNTINFFILITFYNTYQINISFMDTFGTKCRFEVLPLWLLSFNQVNFQY